jgi:hypothetical protein
MTKREELVRTLLWRKWSGEPPLTDEEERAFAGITPQELFDEWAERVGLLMDEAPGFLDDELEHYGLDENGQPLDGWPKFIGPENIRAAFPLPTTEEDDDDAS